MKSNEWYTPLKYINAARKVLGRIELDPASCAEANQIVQAERYYTQQQNGLLLPWSGTVWCNPPYHPTAECKNPQPTWARKLIKEYQTENVTAAILLVSSEVKNRWFHDLLAYPVCFPYRRIFFLRPGLQPSELRVGNCFVYFGRDTAKFVEVFSHFGTVLLPAHSTRPLQQLSLMEA